MPKPNRIEQKNDPFAGNLIDDMAGHNVSAEEYIPRSSRRVAKGIPITSIWYDDEQPRKIFPSIVRGNWDGNPTDIGNMAEGWTMLAQKAYGAILDVRDIILGRTLIDIHKDGETDDAGHPLQPSPPVLVRWLGIMTLAGDIHRKGLSTPIHITKTESGYQARDGHRRLTAYHYLRLYVDAEEYARIPAEEVEASVWLQGSDNNQRTGFNAIGQARLLALLKMEMRKDEKDFIPKHELTTPEGCDRAFYAQAADLRVKRGHMADIRRTMGIDSKDTVYRLNQLLTIPDELWVLADDEDWAEGRIRGFIDEMRADKSPIGDLSLAKPADSPPSGDNRPVAEADDNSPIGESDPDEMQPDAPIPVFRVGDKVRTPNGSEGTIDRVRNDIAWVRSGNKVDRYLPEQLALVEAAKPALAPVERFTPPGMETGTGTPEPDRGNPTPRQKPGTSPLTGKPAQKTPPQQTSTPYFPTSTADYRNLERAQLMAADLNGRERPDTPRDIIQSLHWLQGLTQERAATLWAGDREGLLIALRDAVLLANSLATEFTRDVKDAVDLIYQDISGTDDTLPMKDGDA